MAQLIVFVLGEPSLESDVLDAWLAAGVPGVTMMDSYGVSKGGGEELDSRNEFHIGSLAGLLRPHKDHSHTLLSVVPDDFDVEALMQTTEKVIGNLSQRHTGILFTVPVGKVWGLNKKK